MHLDRSTGQAGILSGDNSFINLTKVSLVRAQPLRCTRYSRSFTRPPEHCSHSPVSDFPHLLEVKIPFYFKQIYHKYNFKRPKQCVKHTQ